MSALAGFWRHDGGPSAEQCAAMLVAQRLYGRDDTATRELGPLTLGRNLTRVLREDAFDAQPVTGGGGRFALVGDLRLDNRAEIAGWLCLAPERLPAMSDADVLMAAYETWGPACCRHLLGDYAFALWDGGERKLVLARDATGQRPLHYFHSPRLTAFASMPKGLLALAEIERKPDLAFVAQGLAEQTWAGSRSYFENISRVRPGHMAVIDAAGERQIRHWEPAPAPLRLRRYADYVEALRTTFDQAVARQLRGESRVAAQLSAGLDSSAVVTSAAIQLTDSGRISAYTAVPRDGYAQGPGHRIVDEGILAAATAAGYANIDHRRVRPADGWSILDTMARVAPLFDQPCPNPCNMGWISAICEQAKADGHRVLFTGAMGNVTLSYSGAGYLAEALARRQPVRFLRQLAGLAGARRTIARSELSIAARAHLPEALQRVWARSHDKRSYLAAHPDLFARPTGPDSAVAADTVTARRQFFDRIDIGNFQKGILGGWGLDLRDPTADRDFIELCLAIPAEIFCRDGVRRSLARDMLAGRLPESHLAETGTGLQAADWHEALERDRDRVSERLQILASVPALQGLLDIERLVGLATAWPTGNWNAPEIAESYRAALLRGLAMGEFVRGASGASR